MTALRWLFAIQLVSMGAMEMSGPFWPLHLRDLGGLSPSALAQASAIAYAGPLLTAMCFTPAWGRLADRVGHKPMVLRALLALVATQAWIACADSVLSVLAARVVQGALAGFIAAAQAYGAQLAPRSERARLMARLQVATAVGSVAGPFLGGVLHGSLGFRTINLIAAAACVACVVAAWLALPALPSRREPATPAAAARDPARARLHAAVIGLLLGIVAVQTARMMPQVFFGLYAEQALALPAWATGLCYGLAALGLCLGAPWWARRIDGADRARVIGRAAAIAATCGLLTLAQHAAVPLPLLLAARLAWGFALGGLLPVFYALLSRDAPDEAQGRVLGAGNAAAKAGALLGSALGGLALGSLPLPWLMLPVAMAYGVAAVGLLLLRRAPSSRPASAPAAPPSRPSHSPPRSRRRRWTAAARALRRSGSPRCAR